MFLPLALLVGQMWLGEITRPRPKKLGFEDFLESNAPSEIRPVVYGAGTFEVTPARIWFGDFKQRAVERDSHWTDYIWAGELAFLLDTITVAYRYYIGEAFQLCYGPDTHVERVTINDRIMYAATVGFDNAGSGFLIDDPQAWGGDQPPGEGGQYSWCDITRGNYTDAANAYLESQLSTPPNKTQSLRGISCLISRGPSGFEESGYIAAGGVGYTPRPREWKVACRRQPNNLLTGFHKVGRHANLMEVLYEWTTSFEYGARLPLEYINLASWQQAAEDLHAEGTGWSGKIEGQTTPLDVVKNIQAQGDIVLDPSPSLGLTARLIRRDYSFASLRILNPDVVTSTTRFSPGAYEDTVNKIIVPFRDQNDNFQDKPGIYVDSANQGIQGGRTVPKTVDYFGVGDFDTANELATRDGRALSVPRAPLECTVRPSFGRLTYRGEVLKYQWTSPTFTKLMRVLKITPGNSDNPDWRLEMIEDPFASGFRVSGEPVPGFTDPAAGLLVAPPSATWDTLLNSPDGLKMTLLLLNTNQFNATINGAIIFGSYAPGGQYARVWVTEPSGVQTLSPIRLAPDTSNKAQFNWPANTAGVYEFCIQTFSLRDATNEVKVCADITVAQIGSPSPSPSASLSPSASVSPSISPSSSVSPSASLSPSSSPSESPSPSVSISASVSPSASQSPSSSESPSVSPSSSASASISPSPSTSPSSSASPSVAPGTRFYLPSSGAAAVSPAFSASWHQTGAGDRLIMSPTKGSTAMTVKSANMDNTAGERFILWRQYVSDPLDAQTITGTVKGQVYCQTSAASSNPTLAVVIRVFSNDGSTERGVLLAISASQLTTDPPVFWDSGSSLSVENRQLKDSSDNTSITLSSVAALAGDRLVIELGFRETGTSAIAVARGYFGEANANDAAENETDRNGGTAASVRNPWVEFTHSFDFQ